MPWLKWYKEFTHEWSKLLDRLAPSLGSMTTTMLFSQQPPFVPGGVEAMTVRIDLPPGDPGSPRSSGRGSVLGAGRGRHPLPGRQPPGGPVEPVRGGDAVRAGTGNACLRGRRGTGT